MKQRILIVDDELGPRESFRMLLKNRFDVSVAASGEEALRLAREGDFAMVFLDLRMPGMDGIRVLSRLRQERPHLPVVIVTAFVTPEATNEVLEMGALDYLIKPFNRRDVDQLVERALKQAL